MKTNSLTYETSKEIPEGKIYVHIRLNDHCKNGHQDFAITGNIFSSKTSTADWYHIAGGCIHDDILKHFPEFTPFVALHLSDYKGMPMYAIENGFYHMHKGFERTKLSHKDKFCEYYRVTPEQYDALSKAEHELEYASIIVNLGILKQWENEANKAIKKLEDLTGDTFIVDSKRTNWNI